MSRIVKLRSTIVKQDQASVMKAESDRVQSDSDSEPGTGYTSLESLGLTPVQLSAIQAMLVSKKQRKIALPRKTPDGLVGCRQGIMMIMGLLKHSSAFSGQSDFLQAIYNLLGAEDDGKGPMKIAIPILLQFAKSEIIYSVWQKIATERSENGFKRGEDRDFFNGKTGIFITSYIHLLHEAGIKLTINGKTLTHWTSQDFMSVASIFQVLINSAGPVGAEIKCCKTTLKGTQCQKPGKHIQADQYYCTQHFKTLEAMTC